MRRVLRRRLMLGSLGLARSLLKKLKLFIGKRMLFMFFGRVGILSISLSFMIADPAEERIQRAETKLIIG